MMHMLIITYLRNVMTGDKPDVQVITIWFCSVIAEDGMKMQGFEGSQVWDTAFAALALISTNTLDESGPALKRAHAFLEKSQIPENCPGDLDYWHRHISLGAWPFSSRDLGWQVSDCTAEALKAILALSQLPQDIVGQPIPSQCLFDSVDFILSMQVVIMSCFNTIASDYVPIMAQPSSQPL